MRQLEAVARWTGDAAVDLDAAMRASLASAKRVCEGVAHGVERVSGGTQSDPAKAPLRDSPAVGSTATQNPRDS